MSPGPKHVAFCSVHRHPSSLLFPMHSSISSSHYFLAFPWCWFPSMLPSTTVTASSPEFTKYCNFSFVICAISSFSGSDFSSINLFVDFNNNNNNNNNIARKLRVTSTNNALRKHQSCWWYAAWNKSCLSVKRTNYNNNFSGPPKTVSKPFSPSLSKFDIDVEINFLRWLCSVDDFWWSLLVVHNVLRLCSWMVL